MAWVTANWFWVLVFILFIGMHLFGHGGHGGHGGRGEREPSRRGDDGDIGDAPGAINRGSIGHQH